ncbi:MAG: 2'-5' RNA ligase family protein [Patescibacteria group bacterium]|nr:2'-5' RNA ligase family protein [Patescibacteria group bacterium]
MKHVIWITPPPPLYEELKKIIDSLSAKYHTPVFSPHMTVVSEINADLETIKNIAGNIAAQTNPLKLSLGPVSFSTTYFQSVFVRVNSTAALMQLNLDLKKAFNLENSVFMPHISLLYGLDDMKIREKIVSQLPKFKESVFEAKEMVVIPQTTNPKSWQSQCVISLGNRTVK